MTAFLRACLTGAALALASMAPAQETPSSEPPEIVVTGREGFDRQVRDFVGALTHAPGQGQLARFEQAVCPVAAGLSPSQKEAVEKRIRRVAEGVGMKAGAQGCSPNILVALVPDKRDFIKALMRKQPSLFNNMAPVQVRRLTRAPGPVAAWQLKGLRRADGLELLEDSAFDMYINQAPGLGSRITETARPHFTAAVVVVELDAVQGLTTTQLADYTAMRTFARTDPSRLPKSASSILNAVGAPAGVAVPITLTSWDLGFLRALYTSPDNLKASLRRTDMRRILTKELERSGENE
ncbi:MAG TPA: hypothetical protein VF631_03310 [Allosphingosinicella sp.]|jgi:hypothetical protein|uniref:hypothetical protein n=1 Tax=Allosphingosinicella sp. TaxID=2823234 RepID=UPI002F2A3A90